LFSEASEIFEKRLARPEASHRGHAHRSLGHLEIYRGQFEAAVDHFRQAVTLHTAAGHPTSAARDQIFEAYAEIARGNTEAATDALSQARETMPLDAGSIPFHVNIGMANLMAAKLDAARRISDSLATRSADDGDQLGEDTVRRINVLEARVLYAEGDVERAIEMLEKEARIATNPNPDLFEGLAEAYAAGDRWEDTAHSLRRLIDLRWDAYEGLVPWVTAHFRIGQVYEQLGKSEEAADSYRQFLELWGDADSELPQIQLARDRLEILDR
jgi:tetratricopeptide (TPR) repeat protein